MSEKKKEHGNDWEASERHRQTLSRLMREMQAGETSAGKGKNNGKCDSDTCD